MKTQIQVVLTVVLFTLTVGCSSPHSAAQVSDPGPPAISEPVSETPEAHLLRLCAEKIAPAIEEIATLADQTAPMIERLEQSERFGPGFVRETFGGCAADAVRLIDSFSNCALWATFDNAEEVFGLWGEAQGVKGVCESGLKVLRNQE